MSKYFINLIFLLSFTDLWAQTDSLTVQERDTVIVYKQKYGLRVGVDLSRPITQLFIDGYSGLEFVGDYRLNYKLFLAGELGREKKTKQEDLYNFTTTGSYIKLGVDYNTYANWYGEQNSIHVGGRYAFSTFSHTLNNHQIFDSSRYWNPVDFPVGSIVPEEFNGRNASWIEAVVGVKAELFANIYLGASARIGFLLTNANRDTNFHDLFVPGFNKVTDGSRFGVGYNYSITYFIPLYKKAKKPKKRKENLSSPIEE